MGHIQRHEIKIVSASNDLSRLEIYFLLWLSSSGLDTEAIQPSREGVNEPSPPSEDVGEKYETWPEKEPIAQVS